MNFDLTPEQQALADSVRRFVEREYDWDTRTRTVRSAVGYDPAHWRTFVELGWLGAGLSEEAGGFGGGAVENAVIAEELGKGLVTEPFAAHVAAAQLLAGSDRLEPLLTGEARIALAVHEPEGRSDYSLVGARYERSGDGYRLTGGKSLVEAASLANQVIIPAQGDQGLALFLVDMDAEGLAGRPYRLLDNRRASDLAFDVCVPSASLLSAGNGAAAAFDQAVDHANVALCAEALGVMHQALWQTRDYLNTRQQFGTPLAAFQALQHRMADMLIELEMTRSLLYHALGKMDGDVLGRRAAVSALKVQAGKAGLFIGRQAIQLHGGIGVTEELPISHYYRRLYVIARMFGDGDYHLDRFADAVDERAG